MKFQVPSTFLCKALPPPPFGLTSNPALEYPEGQPLEVDRLRFTHEIPNQGLSNSTVAWDQRTSTACCAARSPTAAWPAASTSTATSRGRTAQGTSRPAGRRWRGASPPHHSQRRLPRRAAVCCVSGGRQMLMDRK